MKFTVKGKQDSLTSDLGNTLKKSDSMIMKSIPKKEIEIKSKR